MKKIFVCFFFIVLNQPASAQYDTLLHKPYAQKVLGVHAMYRDLINVTDSIERAQKAENIKKMARSNNDRGLELEIDFFLVFWNAFYMRQPKDVSLSSLKQMVEISSIENYYFLKERSLRALAEFYWKIEKNYEKAFIQYLLLDNELLSIKPSDYPEMARDLMQIGEAYYFFQDYKLALNYFKRTIAVPENSFNTVVINNAKNTLGLCYQNMHQYDSAAYYFNEVQKSTFQESQVWKRIALGNLGANYYFQKQYEKAIPLVLQDFNTAVKVNDNGCAAGAAILLADMYMINEDLTKTGFYIRQAELYIKKSEQYDRLRSLYPVMSKWYAAKGNKDLSKIYVDSSVTALDAYNEKFSALKILRAQQKVTIQKEQLQLAKYQLEKQKKLTVRNFLILLVIVLFICSILIYYIQRKKQKIREFKLQAANQELEIAKLKLNQFTEKLIEKNKLLEKLQSQNLDTEKYEVLNQLQQSTILTEDDWIAFQSLFDKAYPGFIIRIKEQLSELSLGELRFFVLSKLNISTKQMAEMQGVSANAIQVMRHRIRKKLDLSNNELLDELIKNI